MALPCRRHGVGFLLQIVCLLVLLVMSPFMFPFYVGVQWAHCARHTLTVTRALNCLLYICDMRQSGMERIALAWLILSGQFIQCFADGIINQLTYSGTELLALRDGGVLPSAGLLNDVPRELYRHHGTGHRRDGKARKRGKRGGVRQRTRRASKLPLPQMLLCNSRSLRNKLDELRLLARGCYEYRESGLMIFTETWFSKDVPDNFVQVDGFSHVRLDRDANSGKVGGGGVCIYIKDSWCSNFAIRDTICNPDLELLCVTLRPHYLPREFSNIFVCAVYVPPSGNANRAANQIADCVHRHLQNKPDAPILILGDFNHSSLNKSLPGFYQYVKCNTRKNNILDKCYGNVRDAYTARAKSPLANSDHNAIHLLPTYRSVFKSSKPEIRTVKVWSDDKIEELKGCFLSTDWDVFLKEADIDRATESTTAYISFCVDSIIPQKTVKIYPNNKPYITKDIKECIKWKKSAFKLSDTDGVKTAQKELNKHMRAARLQHKERAEQNLSMFNSKKLWDSIRGMTNMEAKRKPLFAQDESLKANALNQFYMRFESDNNRDCCDVLDNVNCNVKDRIFIDPHAVTKVFKSMYLKKATGPDNMSTFLLKTFAEELTPVWHQLFQLSIDKHVVPEIWKKSTIIPVPKKACPQEDNDYRPVALTSNVFKGLERLMLNVLRSEVEPVLDKYQFAYTKKRSTSDAISTIMHLTLKHLETPGAYARLLLIDFSSAFNTIQPHILLRKLALLNVNPFLIRWYHSFLTKRPQQVKFNSSLSNTEICSTGAPQGCVSSPFLFILYTNDCVSSEPNQYVVKFSDDTAVLSLLTKNSDSSIHREAVDRFVDWCDNHKLQINTCKTVEMLFDPKSIGDRSPVTIHGNNINQQNSCKYLGIHIDSDLSWQTQVATVCARIHQRLHFLRRLRLFGVSKNIMLIFYRAAIESILRYGVTSWFGNLSVKLKSQILNLVRVAGRIMGHPPLNPQELFNEAVITQAKKCFK